jgi:phthiocerol/phenolphthiocerol synthesis type-I polyketide synthase E
MKSLKPSENNNDSISISGSEKTFQMPDGSYIYHLNSHETKMTFQEIFIDDIYFKHNLKLPQNPYIFDIGANIGLFSIQAKKKYPNSNIFSFEPSPELHQILFLNTKKFNSTIKTFQCGLSNDNKNITFYYYPDYSIMSSFFKKTPEDEQVIQIGIKNSSKTSTEKSRVISKRLIENFKKLNCQTISLSYFIEQKNIPRIDLLKIDAEKSEIDILEGIKRTDWRKIKNIIIESHTQNNSRLIAKLLNKNGYKIDTHQESNFKSTKINNIIARQI